MKENLRNFLKVDRKTFFNPYEWLSVNTLVDSHETITSLVKEAMAKPVATAPETFEESIQRQGLTENDIIEGEKTYRALAIVFFLLGLAAVIYSFYLLVLARTVWGFLLGVATTSLFWAHAFKYDFWALQMRSRKLGMTFSDWKRSYFGPKG